MSTPKPTVPDHLEDAPLSAKLVYVVLDEADGPLSQEEICRAAATSQRTVRSALYDLLAADRVERLPDPEDARRNRYRLADTDT